MGSPEISRLGTYGAVGRRLIPVGSASGRALDLRTTSSPAPLPGIPMQAGWDRSGVPLRLGETCHSFEAHVLATVMFT